jgi:hypothetical protein
MELNWISEGKLEIQVIHFGGRFSEDKYPGFRANPAIYPSIQVGTFGYFTTLPYACPPSVRRSGPKGCWPRTRFRSNAKVSKAPASGNRGSLWRRRKPGNQTPRVRTDYRPVAREYTRCLVRSGGPHLVTDTTLLKPTCSKCILPLHWALM